MEAPPDLECGVAPLGPPAPTQLPFLGHGVLLRNLYAGQEATVRTGHGTTDWSQIGKGKEVYCHPAYLTYMQSTS